MIEEKDREITEEGAAEADQGTKAPEIDPSLMTLQFSTDLLMLISSK